MAVRKQSFDSILRKAAKFHGHLGPFLVVGLRMGLIGLREMETDGSNFDLQATIILKRKTPFSCAIDGIQVATYCTVGNGKLELKDKAGIISAIFKTNDGRQVTISLNPTKYEEFIKGLVKDRQSCENIKLAKEIASLPEEKLFTIEKSDNLCKTDLEFAKKRLGQKDLSLVVAKRGRVLFETQAQGISGLLDAIEKIGKRTRESSVADRIVGRAAALLLAYSGVTSVYAGTISDGGIEILKNHNISHEFDRCVPNILNREKTDVCPFEKLVAKFYDPKKAYDALTAQCNLKQAL